MPEKGHGQLVATGTVAQWRVDMPLVVYPTKETAAQVTALMEKGQTATFDTSRPITIIPTWISGPEPGEDNIIEVTLKYRTTQGETGDMELHFWTPMSGGQSSLSPDQRETMAQFDAQSHDMSCRGIP